MKGYAEVRPSIYCYEKYILHIYYQQFEAPLSPHWVSLCYWSSILNIYQDGQFKHNS